MAADAHQGAGRVDQCDAERVTLTHAEPSAGYDPHRVTDRQQLPFLVDPIGVVDVEAEQVLDEVVAGMDGVDLFACCAPVP